MVEVIPGSIASHLAEAPIPQLPVKLPGPAGQLQALAAAGRLDTTPPEALGLGGFGSSTCSSCRSHANTGAAPAVLAASHAWRAASSYVQGLPGQPLVATLQEAQQLGQGKVPRLQVLLLDLKPGLGGDAFARAADATATLGAALHASVLQQHTGVIAGAVLLLHQVSVITPAAGLTYLCITAENVVQIFPPNGNGQAGMSPLPATATGWAPATTSQRVGHSQGPAAAASTQAAATAPCTGLGQLRPTTPLVPIMGGLGGSHSPTGAAASNSCSWLPAASPGVDQVLRGLSQRTVPSSNQLLQQLPRATPLPPTMLPVGRGAPGLLRTGLLPDLEEDVDLGDLDWQEDNQAALLPPPPPAAAATGLSAAPREQPGSGIPGGAGTHQAVQPPTSPGAVQPSSGGASPPRTTPATFKVPAPPARLQAALSQQPPAVSVAAHVGAAGSTGPICSSTLAGARPKPRFRQAAGSSSQASLSTSLPNSGATASRSTQVPNSSHGKPPSVLPLQPAHGALQQRQSGQQLPHRGSLEAAEVQQQQHGGRALPASGATQDIPTAFLVPYWEQEQQVAQRRPPAAGGSMQQLQGGTLSSSAAACHQRHPSGQPVGSKGAAPAAAAVFGPALVNWRREPSAGQASASPGQEAPGAAAAAADAVAAVFGSQVLGAAAGASKRGAAACSSDACAGQQLLLQQGAAGAAGVVQQELQVSSKRQRQTGGVGMNTGHEAQEALGAVGGGPAAAVPASSAGAADAGSTGPGMYPGMGGWQAAAGGSTAAAAAPPVVPAAGGPTAAAATTAAAGAPTAAAATKSALQASAMEVDPLADQVAVLDVDMW